MNLRHYLELLHRSLIELAQAFDEVAEAHRDEPDVRIDCEKFAKQSTHRRDLLRPFLAEYQASDAGNDDEPQRLHRVLFDGTRDGPLGLIRDLHDLYLMTCECDICWTLISQGAQGARDPNLNDVTQTGLKETGLQMAWLRSRMKQAAPQALVVAR